MAQVLGLTDEEKITLLKIARQAIAARLEGRQLTFPEISSPKLKTSLGAFVTLHIRGQLRGCIGTFFPQGPLYQTVAQMAQEAAFSDPRFPPLSRAEFPQIDIEISVLSPMERIRGVEEIEVGRHGLYIIRGLNRGVLLPQVATEYGWDRYTFLDHTCLKAGLPPGCWQDPETEIYVFTAEIFSEKEFGLAEGA
ncbi:AmmeMemoRadiSam system protein A [Thermosulfuriphilus sp.]